MAYTLEAMSAVFVNWRFVARTGGPVVVWLRSRSKLRGTWVRFPAKAAIIAGHRESLLGSVLVRGNVLGCGRHTGRYYGLRPQSGPPGDRISGEEILYVIEVVLGQRQAMKI